MANSSRKIKITQIASQISHPKSQAKTLKALGLGRVGNSVEHVDNAAIRGQVNKVKHLIKVEELN